MTQDSIIQGNYCTLLPYGEWPCSWEETWVFQKNKKVFRYDSGSESFKLVIDFGTAGGGLSGGADKRLADFAGIPGGSVFRVARGGRAGGADGKVGAILTVFSARCFLPKKM